MILLDPASGLQSVKMGGSITLGEINPYGGTSVTPIGSVTIGGRALLATASGGTVHLWDPATGQQALTLYGHGYEVKAVCLVTVSSPEPSSTVSDDHAAIPSDLGRLVADLLAEDPAAQPDAGQVTAALRASQRRPGAVTARPAPRVPGSPADPVAASS